MKFIGKGSGKKIDFPNGQLFELLQTSALESFNIALTIVKPLQKLERHKHLFATEIYLGLSGQGTVVVADQYFEVGPGDMLVIDPSEEHHAEATEMPFEFYAITTPAFDPDDYHPIG